MANDLANRATPAHAEAQAIHMLRTCLLDPAHEARRVLALTDAIVALQSDSSSR
jgi:hypothetical protein